MRVRKQTKRGGSFAIGQDLDAGPGAGFAPRSGTLATRLPPALLIFAILVVSVHPCTAQDPTELARAGTEAIEARRFGDALDAFTRASSLRPGDASLCFGAGLAAFMLGKDDVAEAQFERALVLKPELMPAAQWLGDLRYRAGRLQEAIATVEEAQRRSPGARQLQPQLNDWRKELHLQNRFRDVPTEHFAILYESAADDSLARSIGERLEVAYARIGKALGVNPPDAITVVLYTREQFGDITDLAAWSVAAYDGRIRLPLAGATASLEELDRLLSHELVHAVVARLGGRTVPAWINEGLATALEPQGTAEVEAHLTRAAAAPALSKLHRSFVGLSTRNAEIAYASSARAVRRLLERHGAPALVELLRDLGNGAAFDRAFYQRLAMRYDDFAALVARE